MYLQFLFRKMSSFRLCETRNFNATHELYHFGFYTLNLHERYFLFSFYEVKTNKTS